jgi:hypothetical protein
MSKNRIVFVSLFLAMIANSLKGQTTFDIYNVSSVMENSNELLPKHRSAAYSNSNDIAQVMVHADGDLKVYWSRIVSSIETIDSVVLPIVAFNSDVAFFNNLNQFFVYYQGVGGIFEIQFQYNSTLGIYQYGQPILIVQNNSNTLFGNPKVESDQNGNVVLLYNSYNSSTFNSSVLNYFIKGRNALGNWSAPLDVNSGLSLPARSLLRGGEVSIEKFNLDNRVYFGTIQAANLTAMDYLYVRSISFSDLMSGNNSNIINHYSVHSPTIVRQIYVSSGVYNFSGGNYNFSFSYIKQSINGDKRCVLKLSNSTSSLDSISNLVDEMNFDDLVDLNHEFTSDFLWITGSAKKRHACFEDFDVFYLPLQLQQQLGNIVLSDHYYVYDGIVRHSSSQRVPRISSIFLNGSTNHLKLWFHDEYNFDIVIGDLSNVSFCGFGKREVDDQRISRAPIKELVGAFCVSLDGRIISRVDIQSIEECSQCSGLVVIQYLDGKTSIIKR